MKRGIFSLALIMFTAITVSAQNRNNYQNHNQSQHRDYRAHGHDNRDYHDYVMHDHGYGYQPYYYNPYVPLILGTVQQLQQVWSSEEWIPSEPPPPYGYNPADEIQYGPVYPVPYGSWR